MNSWQFFDFLFTRFNTVFLVGVQAMAQAASSYVTPALTLGVTLWLAGTTAAELLGGEGPGDPVGSFLRKIARASIVMTAAGTAMYIPVFAQFVLVDLPQEVTTIIANAATVSNGGQPVSANAFDNLFSAGWVGVLQIWNNVSGWSPKSAILGVTAAIEFIIGSIFIGLGFCIYLAIHFTLGLSVAVGPIFISFILWNRTLSMANAWIATLICMIVAQVLLVALLTLLVTVETDILRQMLALNAANGTLANDIGGQLHYLIEAAVLFFLIGFMAYKIEYHARAMVGAGAAFVSGFTAAVHHAAHGTAAAAIQAANRVEALGASIGNSVAGMRRMTPPGRAP